MSDPSALQNDTTATTSTAKSRWKFWRWRPTLRFSLRSLMLLTLAVCLVLGWYAKERYRCQRLQDLSTKRGIYAEGYYPKTKWHKFRESLGILPPNISFASDDETSLSQSDLTLLSSCNTLEKLWLDKNPKLTDADIKDISKMTSLKSLSIESNEVTDLGVSYIPLGNRLEELSLEAPQISDASLKRIGRLSNLGYLLLRSPKVTDNGLVHFANLTKLETLYLEDTQISGQGLAALKALPDLSQLIIDRSQITDANVVHLNDLTHLKTLRLSSPLVTDQGMLQLNCPVLDQLNLDCPQVTGAGLLTLSQNAPITSLSVQNSFMTTESISQLAEFPLEGVGFTNTTFDEQGILDFRGCLKLKGLSIREPETPTNPIKALQIPPQIEKLNLKGTSFSDASFERLEELTQLQKLRLRRMHLTNVTLERISKLPKLWLLELDAASLQEDSFEVLAPCKSLTNLSLYGKIPDKVLANFVSKNKNINELDLNGPEVTDKDLEALSGCGPLRIDLRNTQVTKAFATKWEAMNPQSRLWISQRSMDF